MDDEQRTNEETNESKPSEFALGGGVDIVQSADVDDVEFELYNDDVSDSGTMTDQDRIKSLKEKLKTSNKEKLEYLDGWQRLKADFANYKKREGEEKGEFQKFAREGLVSDIVPVLESFDMAFTNKVAWEKVDASWRKGVEYIHSQLIQALKDHGLTQINPEGEMFNPNQHTAIGTVETTDEGKYHRVAQVVQLGYALNGKLLKSPQVKIYAEVTSDSNPAETSL